MWQNDPVLEQEYDAREQQWARHERLVEGRIRWARRWRVLRWVLIIPCISILAWMVLFLVFAIRTRGDELPDMPKAKVELNSSQSVKPADRSISKGPKVLAVVNAAVAFSDIGYTASLQSDRRFVEYDPLAKPFVHHPGASVALGGAEVAGAWWLAERMKRSERWHRVWWVPQVALISGHGYALGSTIKNWNYYPRGTLRVP